MMRGLCFCSYEEASFSCGRIDSTLKVHGEALVDWLNEHPRENARIIELVGLLQKISATAGMDPNTHEELMAFFSTHTFRLVPVLQASNSKATLVHFAPRYLDTTVVGEEGVAQWRVLELARFGYQNRLRRCICGRWFYAWHDASKFCSDACRHKKYERTPEFKARRREYQRERCRVQKERERKALQRIQRERKRG